jgi:hypothetical protein
MEIFVLFLKQSSEFRIESAQIGENASIIQAVRYQKIIKILCE